MDPKNEVMESVVDLMWTVEEEIDPNGKEQKILAKCEGPSCAACCCAIPVIITKWICGNS